MALNAITADVKITMVLISTVTKSTTTVTKGIIGIKTLYAVTLTMEIRTMCIASIRTPVPMITTPVNPVAIQQLTLPIIIVLNTVASSPFC